MARTAARARFVSGGSDMSLASRTASIQASSFVVTMLPKISAISLAVVALLLLPECEEPAVPGVHVEGAGKCRDAVEGQLALAGLDHRKHVGVHQARLAGDLRLVLRGCELHDAVANKRGKAAMAVGAKLRHGAILLRNNSFRAVSSVIATGLMG